MIDAKSRNPFGEMDVPDPNDAEVAAFAAAVREVGGPGDANAQPWAGQGDSSSLASIEGAWASRWNGGADPAVPGDAPERWKIGTAEIRCVDERVYIRFDWHDGARRALIDAERQGDRLVGKYVNLTNPAITRPWVGIIVSNARVDGRWTNGRLDFRR